MGVRGRPIVSLSGHRRKEQRGRSGDRREQSDPGPPRAESLNAAGPHLCTPRRHGRPPYSARGAPASSAHIVWQTIQGCQYAASAKQQLLIINAPPASSFSAGIRLDGSSERLSTIRRARSPAGTVQTRSRYRSRRDRSLEEPARPRRQAISTRFGMGPAAQRHHRISFTFGCGRKDRELFAPQGVNGIDPSRADCRQPYCNEGNTN